MVPIFLSPIETSLRYYHSNHFGIIILTDQEISCWLFLWNGWLTYYQPTGQSEVLTTANFRHNPSSTEELESGYAEWSYPLPLHVYIRF